MVDDALQLVRWLRARATRESGGTAVEYALVLGLVAAVAVVALRPLGPVLADMFCRVVRVLGVACEV